MNKRWMGLWLVFVGGTAVLAAGIAACGSETTPTQAPQKDAAVFADQSDPPETTPDDGTS